MAIWKLLLPLAVTFGVLVYVGGMLVSEDDPPGPRSPIVMTEQTGVGEGREGGERRGEMRGEDRDRGSRDLRDDIDVIKPRPDDVDDDGADDARDDEGDGRDRAESTDSRDRGDDLSRDRSRGDD